MSERCTALRTVFLIAWLALAGVAILALLLRETPRHARKGRKAIPNSLCRRAFFDRSGRSRSSTSRTRVTSICFCTRTCRVETHWILYCGPRITR